MFCSQAVNNAAHAVPFEVQDMGRHHAHIATGHIACRLGLAARAVQERATRMTHMQALQLMLWHGSGSSSERV